MAGSVKVRDASALLSDVYRNVRMAEDSIINLMPKVTEEKLKNMLTVQISVYSAFSSRAAKELAEAGVKPEEENTMTKMGAKMGMVMNTMLDTTTSHLAEMMINGATMGIIDLEKKLNDGGDGEAERLARDVLRFEKETAERLSTFP